MHPDMFSFCPELQHLLSTRQMIGRSGKVFEEVPALSSINNLFTIRSLCLELKPKRTLEVGFCFGGSGLVFTTSHRDLGFAPQRQHMALDPFQSSVWDDSGLLGIERAGLQGYLDFRPAFSCIVLPRLLSEKAVFDLVYIDGSHLFEDVFVDAYFVSKLLSAGGIVLFDDSFRSPCGKSPAVHPHQFQRNSGSISFGALPDGSRRKLEIQAGQSTRTHPTHCISKNEIQ